MAEQALPDLVYDGTPYRIDAAAEADLLARGVIVPCTSGDARFELSLEHTVDELEPSTDVVARSDAPHPVRLRVVRRNAGLSTGRSGFLSTRIDYVSTDEEPRG